MLELISNYLNKRTNKPFYKIFFISYFICNWKMFYFAFFQNGELFFKSKGISKYEYLIQNYSYFSYNNIYYYNIIFNFIFPLILTILIIWIFPYITNLALKKHIKNKNSEEEIKNDLKLENLETKEKILDKESKIEEKEKPKLLEWDNEYELFKKDKEIFEKFSEIIMRIYNYNGKMDYIGKDEDYYLNAMDKEIITRFQISNIIEKYSNSSSFFLTEKGTYFSKKYEKEGFITKLNFSTKYLF